MTKYWVGVISADHVATAVKQGIMQIGHGRKAGVNRQQQGDWIIYYSPRQYINDKEPLQEFTALGQITDEEPYQVIISEAFQPWRRNVDYDPVLPLPIRPILDKLSFIKNKARWGAAFRYGLLEIPEPDFDFICSKLRQN